MLQIYRKTYFRTPKMFSITYVSCTTAKKLSKMRYPGNKNTTYVLSRTVY